MRSRIPTHHLSSMPVSHPTSCVLKHPMSHSSSHSTSHPISRPNNHLIGRQRRLPISNPISHPSANYHAWLKAPAFNRLKKLVTWFPYSLVSFPTVHLLQYMLVSAVLVQPRQMWIIQKRIGQTLIIQNRIGQTLIIQ